MKYNKELFLLFFLQHVPYLKQVIPAGIWDSLQSNCLVGTDNSLICIDLEQPGNENPQDFFHKNKKKYEHNVNVGLEELDTLCIKYSNQMIQDSYE